MDEKKLKELLILLKVDGKVDSSNQEQSIVRLLEDKLNEYIDRGDAEMEEKIFEALEYQKQIVKDLETSVVVSSAPKRNYKDELGKIKGKAKDTKAVAIGKTSGGQAISATGVATSGAQASSKEIWFVSSSHNADVQEQFDTLREALEQKNYAQAKKHADEILDKEPKNASAYIAMHMAANQISTIDAFFANPDLSFESDNNLKRAQQYANIDQSKHIAKVLFEHRAVKDYRQGLAIKMSLSTSADCNKAALLFEGLGDYKDSKKLAAECRAKEKQLLADEKEANEKLEQRNKAEADKAEIERLRKLLNSTSISSDTLEDVIKDVEKLRRENKEFAGTLDVDIKDAKTRLKELRKKERKNGTGKVAKAYKASTGIILGTIYAALFLVMFYVGASLKFISNTMTSEMFRLNSYPEILSTVFAPLPCAPFLYDYEVANSPVDYVVAYHRVSDLYIKKSDIKNFYLKDVEHTTVDIVQSTAEEVELSLGCATMSFMDSDVTKTLSIKDVLGYVYVGECEQLEALTVESKGNEVKVGACPNLKTITLSDNIDKLVISAEAEKIPEINTDNENLLVELTITGGQTLNYTMENGGKLKLMRLEEYSSDSSLGKYTSLENIQIDGFNEVEINIICTNMTLGEDIQLAKINKWSKDTKLSISPQLKQLCITGDYETQWDMSSVIFGEETYDLYLKLTAFLGETIIIPEQVTKIEALSMEGLKTIELPKTVKFAQVKYCDEFEKLVFPSGVKKSKIPHYVEEAA